MELRQLRYFIAVAEELSFTRAARRIPISQPPLSRQIRRLEAELGFALLERNQHRVALTEAGRAYYDQVKRALVAIDAARQFASDVAAGQVGQLVIGFGGSAGYSFLPHVIRSFREKAPRAQVTLEPVSTSSQLDALLKGALDIGILMAPTAGEAREIETKLLLRDRLIVALPTAHRLAARKRLALADLREEAFIALPGSPRGGGYRGKLMEACRRAGFAPRIVQEVPQIQPLMGLVAAGAGIAVLASVAQRIRLPDVLYRPLTDRHAVMEFVVAWRKADTSPLVREFLAVAERAMKTWSGASG